MYFAKNLRFLRRRAELSQSELGDQLATDYNTISRYENGKSTPKLDALTKLAQVFQVSIEALRSQDLTQQLAPAAPGGGGKGQRGRRTQGRRPAPAGKASTGGIGRAGWYGGGAGAGHGPADGHQ